MGAAPGFLLALLLLLIPEPPLGQFDPHEKTPDRDTLKGLARNPAFLTATFGMAMMTFALGGLQVWMPTFLHRARGYTLGQAGIFFGLSIGANGLVASLAGGWFVQTTCSGAPDLLITHGAPPSVSAWEYQRCGSPSTHKGSGWSREY